MRYYAAVATGRECIKETKLGEVTVKPGDKLLLATFLAGHDRPEEIILDRRPSHVGIWLRPASVCLHASSVAGNPHRTRGSVPAVATVAARAAR